MSCLVCKHSDLETVLKHPARRPFLGAGEMLQLAAFPCSVLYCERCGHLQAAVDSNLKTAMRAVYQTDNVISTPPGEEGWAAVRCQRLLPYLPFDQGLEKVMEVGCQDGFTLAKFLQSPGCEVVGVEPGQVQLTDERIRHLRCFFEDVNEPLESYDLVYSSAVLEHVEQPLTFLTQMAQLVKPGGRVIIEVPNAGLQMAEADLGLYIHEHFSHFHTQSLKHLFENAGLRVEVYDETRPGLILVGVKQGESPANNQKFTSVPQRPVWLEGAEQRFQAKLNQISELIDHLHPRPVGILGACVLTSNVFAWSNFKRDHLFVFDDDASKQGKTMDYLPQVIHSREIILQKGIRDVIVMPFAYFDQIAAGLYRDFGDLTNFKVHNVYQ